MSPNSSAQNRKLLNICLIWSRVKLLDEILFSVTNKHFCKVTFNSKRQFLTDRLSSSPQMLMFHLQTRSPSSPTSPPSTMLSLRSQREERASRHKYDSSSFSSVLFSSVFFGVLFFAPSSAVCSSAVQLWGKLVISFHYELCVTI